ncbi:hypothetical protein EZ428_12015 [Pedobacter frigiditerrae]|uniref:Uncharacterized protein n=1 Tax=Pedobacter frigiditerrae TaxID=2530452 RepID=A0A4R0MVQ9_9SPHI|nr:hypothetical protein [Pedobacter frigiditerrae]TCC90014.1 hypothetical protein EZ428_12015 [Pedobacter frigiditerrae]
MKTKNIILSAILGLTTIVFSCKKIDIPNSNKVNVTFANPAANYVTENITVSPNAVIKFNFTISSESEMETVFIMKNLTEISKETVTTNKLSFTSDKTFAADAAPGVYTYRFLAKDKAGVYMGERKLTITVTNNNDFNYFTVKKLIVPDTTTKINPTYYSLSTNEAFSYTTGATKSNLIDFGYFWDPAIQSGTTPKGHTIYALNITPIPAPLSIYDISTFTKNATLLKVITSPTFANLNSSTLLQSTGVSQLASGTSTSINQAVGKTILFKTVAGKYGALQITYANQENPSKSTYIVFDIKIQK